MIKAIIYFIFIFFPVINNTGHTKIISKEPVNDDIYNDVSLVETGLSKNVFELAIKGLKKLDSEGKLKNPTYSYYRRLFTIQQQKTFVCYRSEK